MSHCPDQIIILLLILLAVAACTPGSKNTMNASVGDQLEIVVEAEDLLNEKPMTVTAATCPRSSGDIHSFYSEGDYWWPDTLDTKGPYIRRDGMTNPENFVAHRMAMRNFSKVVATLVAAYRITDDERYAAAARVHLNAWFVDSSTFMRPDLLYSQAIKGIATGRYIGVIDGIHLIEVARAVKILSAKGYLKGQQLADIKSWFSQYLSWLTTHEFGISERDHGNNHSTWWISQVAAYAALLDDQYTLDFCRQHFKTLLSSQMAPDGGFPDELNRTKPYNYSLFNIEGFAVAAYFASIDADNLWLYESENGSIRKAIDFMLPFIADKSRWPYRKDIVHFDELPIQSLFLYLAAQAYQEPHYLEIWKKLPSKRLSEEVDRNYPIRQPLLWD
jgi:hypothetical protein